MEDRDLLTEDEVIEGVENFLKHKGRTLQRRTVHKASAVKKESGADLVFRLETGEGRGNRYCIEAKGSLRADRTPMASAWDTNFRWAVSQIILRIEVDSRNYNYNYGIALPLSDAERAKKLIRDNWALKHLKIRLYGVYRDETGRLTAREYLPKELYARKRKDKR